MVQRAVASLNTKAGLLYIRTQAPLFALKYGVLTEYPEDDNEDFPEGTPCIMVHLTSQEAVDEAMELTRIAIADLHGQS